MILPERMEQLRHELSATPGVARVFVGRAETFFISGELPGQIDSTALPDHLNRQRQDAGLPTFADLRVILNVVRVLPGAAGGTYFEVYARRPLEF